jgi:hypothetical protein
MLHRGRIEIQGMGPFEVCFRSGSGQPRTTKKIGFYEVEETAMFLVDSLSLPAPEAAKLARDAIALGWSVSQTVVCSDQQLQSVFRPKL